MDDTPDIPGSPQKLREWLESAELREAIGKTLPAHIPLDRYIVAVQNAVRRDPDLGMATRNSIKRSVLELASFGLEPDGTRAWLMAYTPRNNIVVCEYIIGYQGYLDLLMRTGDIAKVECQEVHEADFFEYEFGTNSFLRHKPARGDRGVIVDFYCVVKFKDGREPKFEVMSNAEVEKVRNESWGYQDAQRRQRQTAWNTHYAMMGRKTVFLRCIKLMEKSADLRIALERERDTMPAHVIEERQEQATRGRARGIFHDADTGTGQQQPSAPEPEPPPAPESPPPPNAATDLHASLCEELRKRVKAAKVDFDRFYSWLRENMLVSPTAETLADVQETDLDLILHSWEQLLTAYHQNTQ